MVTHKLTKHKDNTMTLKQAQQTIIQAIQMIPRNERKNSPEFTELSVQLIKINKQIKTALYKYYRERNSQ